MKAFIAVLLLAASVSADYCYAGEWDDYWFDCGSTTDSWGDWSDWGAWEDDSYWTWDGFSSNTGAFSWLQAGQTTYTLPPGSAPNPFHLISVAQNLNMRFFGTNYVMEPSVTAICGVPRVAIKYVYKPTVVNNRWTIIKHPSGNTYSLIQFTGDGSAADETLKAGIATAMGITYSASTTKYYLGILPKDGSGIQVSATVTKTIKCQDQFRYVDKKKVAAGQVKPGSDNFGFNMLTLWTSYSSLVNTGWQAVGLFDGPLSTSYSSNSCWDYTTNTAIANCVPKTGAFGLGPTTYGTRRYVSVNMAQPVIDWTNLAAPVSTNYLMTTYLRVRRVIPATGLLDRTTTPLDPTVDYTKIINNIPTKEARLIALQLPGADWVPT